MSEVLERSEVRTMAFMDETGHTSLAWEKADDQWMVPLIQKKMDEGYTFWIVRRRRLSISAREVEVKLRRAADIGDARRVSIRDPDARKLFEEGKIGIQTRVNEEGTYEPVRRARTAEEAAKADTIAARPIRGG